MFLVWVVFLAFKCTKSFLPVHVPKKASLRKDLQRGLFYPGNAVHEFNSASSAGGFP